MFKKSLLFKILGTVLLITIAGFGIIVYEVIDKEREQIIRNNGIEEAFQDFKTLKAVEKEYGKLKPEWTKDHPNKEKNVAQGIDNPGFKDAIGLLHKGKREGISYIEEDGGKRLLTYFA